MMLGVLPKEAADNIHQLRSERKKAIAQSNYEEARELDGRIQSVKDHANDEAIADVEQQFQTSVSEYLDQFQKEYDASQEDLANAQRDVGIKFQGAFEQLQEAHKRQLLECENDWRRDDRLEHLRRIPKHEEQMELSRKFAADSNYEQAIKLRDSARQIAEEDVKVRVAAREQAFAERRQKLLEKFRGELVELNERFNRERSNVEQKLNEKRSLKSQIETASSCYCSRNGRQNLRSSESPSPQDYSSRACRRSLRSGIGRCRPSPPCSSQCRRNRRPPRES
jgi:hypothetical protein